MKTKTVGIITMHKVWNYGSALQAYATQRIVESIGFHCELIDYIYPSIEHQAYCGNIKNINEFGVLYILKTLARRIKNIFAEKKDDLFGKFYSECLICSANRYNSRKKLAENAPVYDVYMTGSDQVWNPKYIGFDTSFMLDFVPYGSYKISYGSSFTVSEIPEYLKKLYGEHLKDYQYISVREKSGQNIVKELTGKSAEIVCDPTLLLNAHDWSTIAKKSVFKTSKQYLLIYIVGYAFNAYPDVYNYIERVNEKMNLPVIYINTIKGRLKGKYQEINVPNIGPNEFVYLMSHASFIITDSFHGTAFSLNFGKGFISCIKSRQDSDSRVWNLLNIVGAASHAVEYDKTDDIEYGALDGTVMSELENYRKHSLEFLKKSLGYEV